MNIAVIYTLPTQRLAGSRYSVTEEDTEISARMVVRALKKYGHNPQLVPVSSQQVSVIGAITADCIFNLIDWTGNDLEYAQKAFEHLEKTRIPYTGAPWKGYVASVQKTVMKQILRSANIPTPKALIIEEGAPIFKNSPPFPCIVKLGNDHCSIGLDHSSVVFTQDALEKKVQSLQSQFSQAVLVEEFIHGREFQVTALVNEQGEIEVLPYAEIVFPHPEKLNMLTFAGKWEEGHPDYTLSAMKIATDISPGVERLMRASIQKAFSFFPLRDYARFDVRMKEEEVFILEVNANPGIDESMDCGVTLSASRIGLSFEGIVDRLVQNAISRKRKIH